MRLGAEEGAEERSVAEGSVIFVEAELEHRFFDVEEELVVLVVFAPGRARIWKVSTDHERLQEP